MKKTRFELSFREQQIMDLLWNAKEGLTSVDILEQLFAIINNMQENFNQNYQEKNLWQDFW